jgi:uncharacterized protein YecE (DUF72 family)
MDVQLGLFADEMSPTDAAPVGPAHVDERILGIAARLPKDLRLGTSSWSFPGWAELVYDRRASERLLAQHGLGAYAEHPLLRSVGVDSTYYRSVDEAVFREYADAVPDDFRFLVKAERAVTAPSDGRPGSVRGENPLFLHPSYATEAVVGPFVTGLGGKAGPLLFQFSPMPARGLGGEAFYERLSRFLSALPPGPMYAVELRTPALLTERYVEVLREQGGIHAYTVHSSMPPLARQFALVRPHEQPALVIRWMLHSGLGYEAARDRYAPFDRTLDRLAREIAHWREPDTPARRHA